MRKDNLLGLEIKLMLNGLNQIQKTLMKQSKNLQELLGSILNYESSFY